MSCDPIWITSSSGRCVLIIRDLHLEVTVHLQAKFKLFKKRLVFQTSGIGMDFST